MKLLQLFNIQEVYNRYSAHLWQYNNGRLFIDIQNRKVQKIYTIDGSPVNNQEMIDLFNFAIEDITTKVRAEFGF